MMRSLYKLVLTGALALGAASTALAQNAPENSAQSRHTQHGQQIQQGRPLHTPGGELNYNEWKKSDEAKTFDRSTYSGFVKY